MYDYFLKDYCICWPRERKETESWLYSIKENELNKYFSWTFVRNPYDRFVSIAFMFGYKPNELAKNFNGIRKARNIVERHSEVQSLFTHYQGKSIINYIGKYERLQKDFNKLCNKIGLKPIILPYTNYTEHREWMLEMDKYSIDFVNDYYRDDFNYFNYNMI